MNTGRKGGAALGIAIVIALGLVACGGEGSSSEPNRDSAVETSAAASTESRPLTYVALGDSWSEGAHCNCQAFPKKYAEALSKALGRPVLLNNLAGQAQPYFDTPTGGGSTGLRKALETDDAFRRAVAAGDIIVISTGPNDTPDPNDGRPAGATITYGTCAGKDDTACVAKLDRTWHRDFDAILTEIEELRAGRPTAIRLVNTANATGLPVFEDYFEALTQAICNTAEKHDVVCVDVRPVLNGPNFEQPVNDNSQEAMDAVAALLAETGASELD